MAIASLVIGIIAIVLSASLFWAPFVNIIPLVIGIVGIVIGALARKKAVEAGTPTGMPTAGLVLAIIATVFAGIGVLSCTICAGAVCAAAGAANV